MEEGKHGARIDTEDLYGPSEPHAENIQQNKTVFSPDLDFQQETAQEGGVAIDAIPQESEKPLVLGDPLSRPELPKASLFPNLTHVIVIFFIFLLVFIVGFLVGGALRWYIGNVYMNSLVRMTTPTPQQAVIEPDDAVLSPGAFSLESQEDFFGDTVAYEVISGTTRQPVPGISYRLPASTLEPTCNGSDCSSQGTYLPGGTRFTVAMRGIEQPFSGYTEGSIVDGQGRVFDTEQTTVAGYPAIRYTGDFEGSALGGYRFSRMRGVMIVLSNEKTLELNHFNPRGVIADFEGDKVVFDRIVETIAIDSVLYPAPTGTTAQ